MAACGKGEQNVHTILQRKLDEVSKANASLMKRVACLEKERDGALAMVKELEEKTSRMGEVE